MPKLNEILSILKMMAALHSAPSKASLRPQRQYTAGKELLPTPISTQAMKDKEGGNFELAMTEFRDYLRFYRMTSALRMRRSTSARSTTTKGYDNAITAFDSVLEKYPDGKRPLMPCISRVRHFIAPTGSSRPEGSERLWWRSIRIRNRRNHGNC